MTSHSVLRTTIRWLKLALVMFAFVITIELVVKPYIALRRGLSRLREGQDASE